jgi:hypothetical protein
MPIPNALSAVSSGNKVRLAQNISVCSDGWKELEVIGLIRHIPLLRIHAQVHKAASTTGDHVCFQTNDMITEQSQSNRDRTDDKRNERVCVLRVLHEAFTHVFAINVRSESEFLLSVQYLPRLFPLLLKPYILLSKLEIALL